LNRWCRRRRFREGASAGAKTFGIASGAPADSNAAAFASHAAGVGILVVGGGWMSD